MLKQPHYKPIAQQKYKKKHSALSGLIFLLLIWQLLAFLVNNAILLPAPFAVLQALGVLIFKSQFWVSILNSLLTICSGFIVGLVVAIFLGHLVYFVTWLEPFLQPFIYILKSAPLAALTIILMIWLEPTTLPFVLILMAIIPPAYYAAKSGLEKASPKLLEMAYVYRFKKQTTYQAIYLPSLIRELLPSLDYTSGLAWKAGITGEIMAQPFLHIGTNLYTAKIQLESAEVLAYLTIVLIFSFIFSKIISLLSKLPGKTSIKNTAEDINQKTDIKPKISKLPLNSKETSSKLTPEILNIKSDLPSAISIQNLDKSYGELQVISDLSCEIPIGSVTALIGPSGQGKTTFFRILTGLELPDSGKIQFNIEPTFAYAFQDDRFLENLTLSQNILLTNSLSKNDVRAKELLAYWEPIILAAKLPLSKKIKTYSGGMRQKASLIRSLATESNFLILDEVFRELDAPAEQAMLEFLMAEKNQRTILLASHRQDIIDHLAEKTIFI